VTDKTGAGLGIPLRDGLSADSEGGGIEVSEARR
jgi:hypothetical protein